MISFPQGWPGPASAAAAIPAFAFGCSGTGPKGPALASIERIFGAGQGYVNEVFPDPLAVVVGDVDGNPVPHASVAWAVTSGGGRISPATTTTDAFGVSRARFTLGGARTQSVRASIEDLSTVFNFAVKERPSGTNVPLSHRPYALAINRGGIVFAPRLDAGSTARFQLPCRNPTGHVPVGSIPTDVSFDPAGTKAFVSNQDGSVSVIDVASNTVSQTIPIPDRAFVTRTSLTGDKLYVGSANGTVYVYDFAAGRFTDSVAVGDVPQHLTLSPDGVALYVSMRDAGHVVEVDTRTHLITRIFSSTYGIQEALVAPDGAELYVANESGWLEIWSLATGMRTQQVPLGDGPWGMTMSPDGSRLYVGILWDGEVAVVDRTTRAVERYINVEGVPRRIRFGPDNTTLVIANEAGYVTFIP